MQDQAGSHHARPGRQAAQARHGRPASQPATACRRADSPLVHASDRCKGAGPAGGARAAQRQPTASVMCVAADRPGGGGEGPAPCNPLQNGGAKQCCVNAPAGGLVGLRQGVESWRCHLRPRSRPGALQWWKVQAWRSISLRLRPELTCMHADGTGAAWSCHGFHFHHIKFALLCTFTRRMAAGCEPADLRRGRARAGGPA